MRFLQSSLCTHSQHKLTITWGCCCHLRPIGQCEWGGEGGGRGGEDRGQEGRRAAHGAYAPADKYTLRVAVVQYAERVTSKVLV